MTNPDIIPDNNIRSSKTATLTDTTYDEIINLLGNPNVNDDESKVRWSWGFRYKDAEMAIWDWKGSGDYHEWSIYGPRYLWYELLPNKVII